MKVEVTFMVDVDFIEGPTICQPGSGLAQRVEAAVAEAINNAVVHAQADGHSHGMQNEIAIFMDGEVVAHIEPNRL